MNEIEKQREIRKKEEINIRKRDEALRRLE